MIGYDNLDLLGVRYDAELELQAKHNLAEKIVSECKVDCKDDVMSDEFYKKCIKSIRDEMGDSAYDSDVEEVWKIIKENYL